MKPKVDTPNRGLNNDFQVFLKGFRLIALNELVLIYFVSFVFNTNRTP